MASIKYVSGSLLRNLLLPSCTYSLPPPCPVPSSPFPSYPKQKHPRRQSIPPSPPPLILADTYGLQDS
eukprot:104178-Hanusia_phi.AAC.1